jgi:hypothetical protein
MAGEVYHLIEDEEKKIPGSLATHRNRQERKWTFLLGALILSIGANLIQSFQHHQMKINCGKRLRP